MQLAGSTQELRRLPINRGSAGRARERRARAEGEGRGGIICITMDRPNQPGYNEKQPGDEAQKRPPAQLRRQKCQEAGNRRALNEGRQDGSGGAPAEAKSGSEDLGPGRDGS